MIVNYEECGFKIKAKKTPRSCIACPFWCMDSRAETGMCFVTGHEVVHEKLGEGRMNDCPIIPEA